MRANFILSGVWEGIRRNLSMTIALILSTSILLTFVGAGILANRLTTKFQSDYEGKLNVSVYVCAKFSKPPCNGTTKTTPAATEVLRKQLVAYPRVVSVKYVSEQEQYIRARAIEPEGVRENISVGTFPASFTVKLKDIGKDYDGFAKTFESNKQVSGVTNQIRAIKTLLDAIDRFRALSLGIALVVLIASVLLIANTVQVAAAQRKNETSIMRLVGASRWMTELPFMLETVIAVFFGGIFAFGMVALGKYFVLNKIFELQVENGVIPSLNMNDVLVASGVSLIGGIVLAAVTAFGTLRLYVKL